MGFRYVGHTVADVCEREHHSISLLPFHIVDQCRQDFLNGTTLLAGGDYLAEGERGN